MDIFIALTRDFLGEVIIVALGMYLGWLYNYINDGGGVYLELMHPVELGALVALHIALIYFTIRFTVAL